MTKLTDKLVMMMSVETKEMIPLMEQQEMTDSLAMTLCVRVLWVPFLERITWLVAQEMMYWFTVPRGDLTLTEIKISLIVDRD
jgi:hypothetical protein